MSPTPKTPGGTPPGAGGDKSQQTSKEGAAHTSGAPDYSGYPYGPGPQAGFGWSPYGRPPFMPYGPFVMPPYGQQQAGAPPGQQQPGAPYAPSAFGMPFWPQQCFMPGFGWAPFQWFWSWLMPWWWSWLMSWWAFPGGFWPFPPFPNPAQNDMTMQFAATRADFWRHSFEAMGKVAEQAANASRFPPYWGPAMPAGPADQPTNPKVDMQDLNECLKSMRDPAQAQVVRYAVILLQQAEEMRRRGRAGGEDWR
jgi:hypothetical protein